MNIVTVYCPECKEKGYRKMLLKVDSGARGIIYPWCKCCHKNVAIDLSALSAIAKR